MSFDDFHGRAWSDHATDAAAVASRLAEGSALVQKSDQLPLLARLATHVLGEHLGRWQEGQALLRNLRAHPLLDEAGKQAIDRFERALRFCAGEHEALAGLAASERARVLCVAAPALAARNQVGDGARLLGEAGADVARLGREDPAHRDLAVAGNNLALALEQKPDRTPAETELMLLAASLGRREWEIAGGPVQVMRAEYRLAISHVEAGLAAEAVRHAEIGLELAAAHSAGDFDVFFLFEALALAERARGRLEAFAKAVARAGEYFGRLEGDDRKWCEPVFEKLAKLV
jgi:hypothetical protein